MSNIIEAVTFTFDPGQEEIKKITWPVGTALILGRRDSNTEKSPGATYIDVVGCPRLSRLQLILTFPGKKVAFERSGMKNPTRPQLTAYGHNENPLTLRVRDSRAEALFPRSQKMIPDEGLAVFTQAGIFLDVPGRKFWPLNNFGNPEGSMELIIEKEYGNH